MLETFKKKVARNVIGRFIISAVIIGGIIIYGGKSLLMFFQGPQPITAGIDYEAMEGSYVGFDAKYFIDEYVRQTSKNTETKKETLKNISYIIYFDEDGYFFGAELSSSKESEMDQYIDTTWSWLAGDIDEVTESKQLKGTWTKLSGKRLQYYEEQITDDLGEEYLQIALPYYIDTNKVGERDFFAIIVMLAALALAVLFIVYTLIRFLTGSTQKNLNKYIANHPEVSMEHFESDFATATKISGSIWIGKRWTYYATGIYPKIYENKDLVWAYYYRRTGRYSESSLRLYDKNKKLYSLSATKQEAMDALDVYDKQQPHMVLGYKKELEKMFQKEFQEFLNIRYNRPVDESGSTEADAWDYGNPEES